MNTLFRNITSTVCAFTLGAGLALGRPAPTVKNRQQVQQNRIHHGVNNGELTKRETLRLERNAARIHRQTKRDRIDGGVFTPRERAAAQAKLNKQSKAIAKQKHDKQEQ